MNTTLEQAAYHSILDPGYHLQLIRDIDQVVRMAGISKRSLHTSMKKVCSPEEITWFLHYKQKKGRNAEGLSLVYTPAEGLNVSDHMMALAGAFVRNYIDARLMSVQEVIVSQGNGWDQLPSVLLIPNFFIPKSEGGHISTWHVSELVGMLIERKKQEKSTVVYVQNWGKLKAEYGQVVYDLLTSSQYARYPAI